MIRRFVTRTTTSSLFVLAMLAPLHAAAGQEGPHGIWEGAIEVPGQPLEVIVTLRHADDGTWTGTIDIPAQNAEDFPLSDVSVVDGTVSFAMAGVQGSPTFTGTWNDGTQTINGDFRQGGGMVPFSLARTGDVPAPSAARGSAVDAETADAVTGTWQGTLSAGGADLRLIFHLAHTDGALTGTMDSPDQGQNDLPLSTVAFDGTTLRIDLTYAGAYFEGTLTDGGASIEGRWNQGGAAFPLTLERQ
jgi:hypothetical protein